MSKLSANSHVEHLNKTFCALHTAKEDAFWSSYMGLEIDSQDSRAKLDRRDMTLKAWLQDPVRIDEINALPEQVESDAQPMNTSIALDGWLKTFKANSIESEQGRSLAAEIIELEGKLAQARAAMESGYRDAEGVFNPCSSVRLGVMLTTSPDESLRRGSWDALRDIESFVLQNGFIELVKARNKLGRMLGGEDYYDWKVRRVEGMSKREIFHKLDELETLTRDASTRGLSSLDEGSLAPWNIRYETEGDLKRQRDPWFPFQDGVRRWGKSFAGLGITYANATMVLDLLDRKGKYENGFMHGPEISWMEGEVRHPARIHFTANAIPGMPGSGERALATLFHEGGHAAHFANVSMPAPCFGQEFAPTSVAFAEIQSMFLDSLTEDPDWQRRYALDSSGIAIPVDLIEEGVRQVQPHEAWKLRCMMAVCYAEKAIYELPDDCLTPEGILDAIRSEEKRLVMLEEGSPRPVLSVPHLLSGEASAYYHGYVLAQMGVEQTRTSFIRSDGYLLDNQSIGPSLKRHYWQPGNSRSMDEMLKGLTGEPLQAKSLASRANRSAEQAIEDARSSMKQECSIPRFDGDVELEACIRIIHGHEEVAVLEPGKFDSFSDAFSGWIDNQIQSG